QTNKKYEKKSNISQTEPEVSQPLNNSQTSKKPRKSHQAKGKENVNPNNEETTLRSPATSNQLQNLQSEQYAEQYCQQNQQIQNQNTSFLAAQQSHAPAIEPYYIEDQWIQNQNTSFLAVSRVQPNGSEIDPFSQHPSGSNEHMSEYEEESSEDRSSEDEIFSSLNQYNLSSSNIQNADEAHLLRWLET
ncbi:28557_t:CDS:2, partial [Racocetra persica]